MTMEGRDYTYDMEICPKFKLGMSMATSPQLHSRLVGWFRLNGTFSTKKAISCLIQFKIDDTS